MCPDDDPHGLQELRDLRANEAAPPQEQAPPRYKVHRARPSFLRRGTGGLEELRHPDRRRIREPRRISAGRVAKWVALAVTGWLALSLVLFMLSAQLRQGDIADDAGALLGGGGYTLTSANTILVLGSDARTKGTKEPGARVGGPSRADSILLVRAGGGASARLSIPRDTVVPIPGHGRNKINSALAFGGPALAIKTVEDFLGVNVNHLVQVDFENFPQLIDALGGIDYKGGCVISRINGGFKNGGFTLRLKRGTTHINGKQALALARTRKNECNPREDDLTRARRQQKLLGAIKDRVKSPATFFRLPFVSWAAPKAIRSDMSGPSLLGLFGALATGGDPNTRVLKPSGGITLADGGQGLTVSEETVRREVKRFLKG